MNVNLLKIAKVQFDKAIKSGGHLGYPGEMPAMGGIVEPRLGRPGHGVLKPYLKQKLKRKPSNNKWLKFYKQECKRPKYKKMNSRKCMSEVAKEYRKGKK